MQQYVLILKSSKRLLRINNKRGLTFDESDMFLILPTERALENRFNSLIDTSDIVTQRSQLQMCSVQMLLTEI